MSLTGLTVQLKSAFLQLTDASGETTSHLMGTFYRTIRMVDNGIKPVYVFDGKPPTMKSGELEKGRYLNDVHTGRGRGTPTEYTRDRL